MIPVIVNSDFISNPNGTLPVILSLFPLTSPTAMLSRLSAGAVPFW
jgi:ABC-2 type transport system permease protein